jgi:hypothetical protein
MTAATDEPDLLFSFMGGKTHKCRESVLGLRHPRGRVVDTSAISFFQVAVGEALLDRVVAQREYQQLVGRSMFVLCPRGHGTASFRLYETLAAGRVPVIISDAWLPPADVDWDGCAVRIAESQVSSVTKILERLEPEWPAMAAAAQRVYAERFAQDRLWDYFTSALEGLLTRYSTRSRWRDPSLWRVRARHLRGRLNPP